MKRVLFVCTGNTCRSPMAEGFFRKLVENRSGWEVASAGIMASAGDEASPETLDILRQEGIRMEGFRSKPVTEDLLTRVTHVFALSYSHFQSLERRFPRFADKIFLLSEFTPDDEFRGLDVPDPIGGGPEAYRETRDILLHLLPSIVAFLDQTSPPSSNA